MIRLAFPTFVLASAFTALAAGQPAFKPVLSTSEPVLFTNSFNLAAAADEPGPSFAPAALYWTINGPIFEDDSDYDGYPVSAMFRAPIAACFDSLNPPSWEVRKQLEELMAGGPYQPRYWLGTRWPGGNNVPLTLTYSFVPDGTTIPGNPGPQGNSTLFATLDGQFANFGGRATWIALFEQSFARWAQLSGLSYTRVRNGTNDWDDGAAWGSAGGTFRGTIRIAMRPVDGGNGILAFNSFPQSGDMVLDSGEAWAGNNGANWRFMRNVLMHEHGHGLGFFHVCPANQTKLMEPFISLAYDGPQQDDIRAVQNYYGDEFEPNNSVATATDLGSLNPGVRNVGDVPSSNGLTPPSSSLLGLSPSGDSDYFKITLNTARLVNVRATPIGSNYADYQQDQTCNTTTPSTNSLAIGDIRIDVVDGVNGATSYGVSNNSAAGVFEEIRDVLCPAGVSSLRIGLNAFITETQLYRLTVTVQPTSFSVTASDNLTNLVRLNWTAVPNATSYQIRRGTVNSVNQSSILGNVATNTFDDTTAVPGTTYFYWIRVTQNGTARLLTENPDTGTAVRACVADVDNGSSTGTPDNAVTLDDLLYYLGIYEAGAAAADVDDGSGTGTTDGGVTIDDLLYFLVRYDAGC